MKHILWLFKQLLHSVVVFDGRGVIECLWLISLHIFHLHNRMD